MPAQPSPTPPSLIVFSTSLNSPAHHIRHQAVSLQL
jgi:hypothetical protein